ncbi:MAG: cyclase [Chloroflexia bacterium]|nr:cyclase [Chloroflexia bacterium]MDQ3411529.1 cyclase [Chloroflexota bacterium]
MPAMLVRHKVADYGAWRPVFDEDEVTRRANGSRGGWIFRGADDPNEVVILLEWDDLERARLFADSDDLRETMERAGVTDRPDIWLLEDVGRPTV